ncbi:MAG: hypothetical protein AMXMBFR34_22930 [Myxococcaceae bacterium]
MSDKPHTTLRLWVHALKRAGTAAPDGPLPDFPRLKMRDLAFALLHFSELLEGQVPAAERGAWAQELQGSRWVLTTPAEEQPATHATLGRVETAPSWSHLARAFHQAAHRAVWAPGLCGPAQRAAVGMAFTLFRTSAPSRAAANQAIRRALERLEAGLWLSAARARLGDKEPALATARGWWGGAALALFEDAQGGWWLVRLTPGRPVSVERGARDDLLACVPDAHFASAVRTVWSEQR